VVHVTTGYVIHADDGRAWHTEILRGVAACGRTFDVDRADVDREPFDPPEARDDPHATVCFDCFGHPRRQPQSSS
jgi:hypothetical protein